MEKTQHRPDPLDNPRAFQLPEEALGKLVPIRDMTNEQLQRHLDAARDKFEKTLNAKAQIESNASALSQECAVLAYEIHTRRTRTAEIAKLEQQKHEHPNNGSGGSPPETPDTRN
jgi:hypothetical protein